MKLIPISQKPNCKYKSLNLFAMVDDSDYEWLNKLKWYVIHGKRTYYATRSNDISKSPRNISMHRTILGVTNPKELVDHIDGNGLNNQRSNLRKCNFYQNSANRKRHNGSSSQYKGVTWNRFKNRWMASIASNHKQKFLGYYNDEINAAVAYNEAAMKLHGDFAKLNKIPPTP